MSKIYKINSAQIHLVKSRPESLIICVIGSVGSSGWENPELSPWVYVSPPADGIYNFDFVATPPTAPSLTVVLPIATAGVFPEPPANMKGVRIHSSSNAIEIMLDANSDLSFPDAGVQLLNSGLPWPGVYYKQ